MLNPVQRRLLSILYCYPSCALLTHSGKNSEKFTIYSVGRRDHIMDIALKGLLESTTRVVSGIALDSAWLELQVRLFQT